MSESLTDYATGEIFAVDLDVLRKPFPAEAIKTREGVSGKRLSYVEGHTVILRLIEATRNCYDVAVRSIQWREGQGKNGEQSLCLVTVALTIPGLGTREAIGVQMVSAKSGEDLIKGAVTDGVKKAATMFGVGLELYGPDYEDIEAQRAEAWAQLLLSVDDLGMTVYGEEWDRKRGQLVEAITKGRSETHTDMNRDELARLLEGLRKRHACEATKQSFADDPVADGQGPITPTISQQQLRRMMGIAKTEQWTNEELHLLIARPAYGSYAHRTDITPLHYDRIIAALGSDATHAKVRATLAPEPNRSVN